MDNWGLPAHGNGVRNGDVAVMKRMAEAAAERGMTLDIKGYVGGWVGE